MGHSLGQARSRIRGAGRHADFDARWRQDDLQREAHHFPRAACRGLFARWENRGDRRRRRRGARCAIGQRHGHAQASRQGRQGIGVFGRWQNPGHGGQRQEGEAVERARRRAGGHARRSDAAAFRPGRFARRQAHRRHQQRRSVGAEPRQTADRQPVVVGSAERVGPQNRDGRRARSPGRVRWALDRRRGSRP